jgi:hypothetical protein
VPKIEGVKDSIRIFNHAELADEVLRSKDFPALEIIAAVGDSSKSILDIPREEWPYGMYITKSGATYLFNRGYSPIWELWNNQVQRVKKGHFVDDVVAQHFFYNDWVSNDRDDIRERIWNVLKFWLDDRIHVIHHKRGGK